MHSISGVTLFDYVKELASPKYEGRLTGTAGYNAAARWTEQLFKDWKIRPAGDNGGYEGLKGFVAATWAEATQSFRPIPR